jgi:6-phosphogluconolactonase
MKSFWGRALGLGLLAVFVAACSSGGNGGNNPPPPTVYKYYAYVTNYLSGNVSAYTINASTGALTAVAGSPFAAGDQTYSAVIAITRIAQ